MERKIMVEVSEQELELIKKGALKEKPKEITLKDATIQSLINELLKRIPEQNKVLTKYDDIQSQCTIYSSKAETTFWAETFENKEEEFKITISLSNTGIYRKKESDK